MGRPVKRKAPPSGSARRGGAGTIERRAPSESATQRRNEVIEGAARVYARKGVGNTTMRDIADEVGILAGSLYHHFESKETLLNEILHGVLDDLTVAYEAVRDADLDPRAAIEELILAGMRFVTDHRDVTAIVQNDHSYLHDLDNFEFVDEVSDLHRRIWRTVLQRGVDAGVLREDIEIEIAYRSMMSAIVSEVRWQRAGRRRKPTAEYLASQHASLYLGGLLAETHR